MRGLQSVQTDRASKLRRVGETCLWVLVIGVTILAVLRVARSLQLVFLPVLLALVLSTLLGPPTRWLRARGWPPGVAAFVVLLVSLLVFGALAAWIVPAVSDRLFELEISLTGGLREVERWLVNGPLGLSQQQVAAVTDRLIQGLRANRAAITGTVVTGASLLLQALTGFLLALVVLFFFLKDGDRMWTWLQTLAPRRHRTAVQGSGEHAYSALSSFLRAQTLVAIFDATLIGLTLVLIGLPLALPLTVLTFFGAYVPYIGAIVPGGAAVLVALVTQGSTAALIVLAAILVVQQLEGNLFQPMIMGRALDVHPVVILLAVTAGGVVAGIIGVIVATPLVAAASGIFSYLRNPPSESEPIPGAISAKRSG